MTSLETCVAPAGTCPGGSHSTARAVGSPAGTRPGGSHSTVWYSSDSPRAAVPPPLASTPWRTQVAGSPWPGVSSLLRGWRVARVGGNCPEAFRRGANEGGASPAECVRTVSNLPPTEAESWRVLGVPGPALIASGSPAHRVTPEGSLFGASSPLISGRPRAPAGSPGPWARLVEEDEDEGACGREPGVRRSTGDARSCGPPGSPPRLCERCGNLT